MSEWMPMLALAQRTKQRGRLLVVTVAQAGDRWIVTAIETSAAAATESSEAVFGDHGHEVVGTRPKLSAALRLGDQYAKKWRGAGGRVEACACEEIAR